MWPSLYLTIPFVHSFLFNLILKDALESVWNDRLAFTGKIEQVIVKTFNSWISCKRVIQNTGSGLSSILQFMYFQNPEHYTQAAFRKSLLLCTGWRLVKRNQVFIFKKCSPSIICNHQETPNQIGPNLKVEASLLFAGASISSLRRSDGLFAREKLLLSEGFSWLCTWWWEEGG